MRGVSVLDSIVDRARQDPRRIVLPESTDPRMLRAATRLASRRIGVERFTG